MSIQDLYIGRARIRKDFEGILALQKANHFANLSESEKLENGYVTLSHTMSQLEEMTSSAPQIIVKDGEEVIGYALSLLKEHRDMFPILRAMFEMLDNIIEESETLRNQSYYVMGQVCISKQHRGRGIFGHLYEEHQKIFSEKYDLCITEASVHNIPSMRAHTKVGFEIIREYSDVQDDWAILAWDWN